MKKFKPTYEELENRLKKLETELDELKDGYRSDIDEQIKIGNLLHKSEKLYRLLFNLLPYGGEIINTKGIIIKCSPSTAKMLGYKPSELIGKHITKFLTPDSIHIFKKNYPLLLKGESKIIDICMVHKNGSILNIMRVAQPITDNRGRIESILSLNIDITKQKLTEKKLQKSEKNYRMLIESASDAFFQGDEHGNFILVNNKTCELTGYSKDELLRMNMKDLFSKNQIKTKPLQYKLLEKGEVIKNERVITRKDGTKLSIEMHSKMMPDKTYQSFFRDITERKKNEAKLKKSEAKFRLISENSKDIICIHYPNGKYKYVSPSSKIILGYDNEKLIGTNPLELVHPDDIDNLIKNRVKIKKEGSFTSTYRIRKKSGEYIWFESANQIIKDDAGNIIYSVSSSRDITERIKTSEILKKNEERLKELNATKDKFFSIIAHDLTNPIGNIMNFSKLLSNNFTEFTNEEKKEFVENIYINSRNTYYLLQNLLEWSRTQTNRIKLSPEIFSIDKIVINNFELIKSVADAKNISLISRINPDHKIFADKNMISTVIRNLVNNAIKFTDKGNITISSVKEDNMIKISIDDTGIGINKKNISKLFKIDKNFSTNGTSGEKGTGLGLILCKEFVEKNHGKIWVESEVGKGSKFIIQLKAQ